MKPSIETATKLAAALDVSLDYLVGIGELQVFDKSLLRRVEELANLPEQDRQGGSYLRSMDCLGMLRQGWRINEKAPAFRRGFLFYFIKFTYRKNAITNNGKDTK